VLRQFRIKLLFLVIVIVLKELDWLKSFFSFLLSLTTFKAKLKSTNFSEFSNKDGSAMDTAAPNSFFNLFFGIRPGISERAISAKLKNGVKDYVIIAKEEHGSESIIADGIEYNSIMDAVRDNRAKNRFIAYRLLKNPKRKDWNYLSPKKRIDK
jgi:hypothetical protein